MKTERSQKSALVCAGGVVEGAVYQVGALCALEEAVEGLDLTEMDVYVGVSSGALITALLANGISPRTMSRAIISKADPVLNVDPKMLFSPAIDEYKRCLTQLPLSFFRAVRYHLARPWDISWLGAMAGLAGAMPLGLFDNDPIREHLTRVFSKPGRTDDFRRLKATLRIVAMHLDSAEITTFGDEATAHVSISKAVQASTALPGFYTPVEVDGQFYIDGVARRTVNASVALDEGATLVFAVNPIVPGDMREQFDEAIERGIVDYGLPAILSQTFRAMVYSRMEAGFRNYQYAYPDADLIRIEPRADDARLFFSNIFSYSNRFSVCDYAYRSTRSYLRQHAEEIDVLLRRHDLRLRREVLDDRSRTLFEPSTPAGAAGDVFQRTEAVLQRLDSTLKRVQRARVSDEPPEDLPLADAA